MNPDHNPTPQSARNLDPYFEPRDMSCNWDLSELLSPAGKSNHKPSKPVAARRDERESEPHSPTDAPPASSAPHWDPFPKPGTMPSKWDMSEFNR
jgi:hypothetical protein